MIGFSLERQGAEVRHAIGPMLARQDCGTTGTGGCLRSAHDRNSRPCVTTRFFVATGLGLGMGDQGRNKGFPIATRPFGH